MSSIFWKVLQASGPSDPPGSWDLSYAYYNDPNPGWEVSKIQYSWKSFSVSSQESSPSGVSFKPDGTKMYIIGGSGKDVNEYNLSTAWDVSTASYVRVKSVSAQAVGPTGVFFKSDGTKMYVAANLAPDGLSGLEILEYNLSTAWNVSTASFSQSLDVSSKINALTGVFFRDDGLKMYLVDAQARDITEYTLSTAWNVSTASYVQEFSVQSQNLLTPETVFFKSDGTKMYVSDNYSDNITEYNLSTAWNISTASYSGYTFSLGSEGSNPKSIYFRPDGKNVYVVMGTTVYQYSVGGFSVSSQDLNPIGIFFKPDGTKMYVAGAAGYDINEYSLSTAWDTSSASYVRRKVVGSFSYYPRGIFFHPDGTRMYVSMKNPSTGSVKEYSLSTAWDVSTASFVYEYTVNHTEPNGVFFKTDGTKMYTTGASGTIHEYSLSTAWDTSTSTYVQSISAPDTTPTSTFFKDDGTKMFVLGDGTNDVDELSLSTAWDISTASLTQTFDYLVGRSQNGLYFRPDGTQMFVVNSTRRLIQSYSIGES